MKTGAFLFIDYLDLVERGTVPCSQSTPRSQTRSLQAARSPWRAWISASSNGLQTYMDYKNWPPVIQSCSSFSS